MKEIKISGFTNNTTPDDKPAVVVFGEENTGKSRFGCTAPCDEGVVGYIALDKNAKGAVDKYKRENGLRVLVNERPFMGDKESIRLALLNSEVEKELQEIKTTYTGVVQRVFEQAMALAAHPDVESIVVDAASQLNDWIIFSHFGRKNQIKPTSRGASNQDFIDFINALRYKNLVLIHRAQEIWKDTGAVDPKTGLKIQEPSGKFKPDGFSKIGGFVTAVVELTAKRKLPEDATFKDKYRLKVVTCKGNTLLEGQDLHDYGVSGETISWDNFMAAIGLGV